MLGNGFEQRYGLCGIAAVGIGVTQAHRAFFDGLLHAADDQTFAQFGHAFVAKRDHFGEVVSRVHMHDGERQFVRAVFELKRFECEMQYDDGVFAAGEQQGGVAAFGGDLAQNVDGLGFEPVQMRAVEGLVKINLSHFYPHVNAVHIPCCRCVPTTSDRRVHPHRP